MSFEFCYDTKWKITCHVAEGLITAYLLLQFLTPLQVLVIGFFIGLTKEFYYFINRISTRVHLALFSTQMGNIIMIVLMKYLHIYYT